MSVFQCSICGCAENTALTRGFGGLWLVKRDSKAYKSYRKLLGLKEGEPYGSYCSMCSPIWYDKDGKHGIGPIPEEAKSDDRWEAIGMWHKRFKRSFYLKGTMFTDRDGNLAHKETKETDLAKYSLGDGDDFDWKKANNE